MLHKCTKVSGYHILATDGVIGHVDDFLFDERWSVAYLVVDTSNWLGGKSVIVSTDLVTGIDSPARQIQVRVTRKEIEQSRPVDAADIELLETLPPFLIF
jgi:PRC-barrel domain protein